LVAAVRLRYEQLVRQSVPSMKAEQIATFLGRQITPLLAQEGRSQFSTQIEGTCIKHNFGKCSIKTYDKHAVVPRIETTANDMSFFKHHRNRLPRRRPRWNIAPGRRPGNSHRSRSRSVARSICGRSCWAANGVISPACPRRTTSPPGSERWSG
jgi:hypothetical protein